jgi:hypothetical protein
MISGPICATPLSLAKPNYCHPSVEAFDVIVFLDPNHAINE